MSSAKNLTQKLGKRRPPGRGRRLDVVRRGDHWYITGLEGKKELMLLFRIPYPESETPEIGDIKSAERMLHALYDEWQTSDELEAEKKRHGDQPCSLCEGRRFVCDAFGMVGPCSNHPEQKHPNRRQCPKCCFPDIDTKTHCPDCGESWNAHDFGVPKPFCPRKTTV